MKKINFLKEKKLILKDKILKIQDYDFTKNIRPINTIFVENVSNIYLTTEDGAYVATIKDGDVLVHDGSLMIKSGNKYGINFNVHLKGLKSIFVKSGRNKTLKKKGIDHKKHKKKIEGDGISILGDKL